jgi:hypothetical protein
MRRKKFVPMRAISGWVKTVGESQFEVVWALEEVPQFAEGEGTESLETASSAESWSG